MIILKAKIKRKGLKPRDLNIINKQAYGKTAIFWHSGGILAKKFTRAGAAEHGYKKRKPKYMRRKAAKFGHQRPLEFTGRMKRKMLFFTDIRSTSKSGKIILRGQTYLHMYRKDFDQPHKAAEIRHTSQGEGEKLAEFFAKSVQEGIDSIERSATPRGPVKFATSL